MPNANSSNTGSVSPKRRDFLFTLGTAAAASAGLAGRANCCFPTRRQRLVKRRPRQRRRWSVRSRHERAIGSVVIDIAAGDTSVGSTPISDETALSREPGRKLINLNGYLVLANDRASSFQPKGLFSKIVRQETGSGNPQ